MAAPDVDWSLNESALRKKLLQLSKLQLIKVCKQKDVQYSANKKQCIDAIIAANKSASKPAKRKSSSSASKATEKQHKQSKGSNAANQQEAESKQHEDSTKVSLSALQSNYFPKNGYVVNERKLDAIARVLLMAVYDDNHELSVFRGMRYIMKKIWEYAIQFNRQHYARFIYQGFDATQSPDDDDDDDADEHRAALIEITRMRRCYFPYWWHDEPAFNYSTLRFPQPLRRELNVNMMPIKMDYKTFVDQLPAELHGYIAFLKGCLQFNPDLHETVCYVTIHESFVQKGRTQRRPGLHIEYPGNGIGGEALWVYGWGGGYAGQDGIFMASSVDETCVAWNCEILQDEYLVEEEEDIVGEMGDMEHLRRSLPPEKRQVLKANVLYWLTDKTPHEVLPMKKSGYRQFFRLVSSRLGVWYEQHSTKNPLGIKPDQKITTIVKGNKFERK